MKIYIGEIMIRSIELDAKNSKEARKKIKKSMKEDLEEKWVIRIKEFKGEQKQ